MENNLKRTYVYGNHFVKWKEYTVDNSINDFEGPVQHVK